MVSSIMLLFQIWEVPELSLRKNIFQVMYWPWMVKYWPRMVKYSDMELQIPYVSSIRVDNKRNLVMQFYLVSQPHFLGSMILWGHLILWHSLIVSGSIICWAAPSCVSAPSCVRVSFLCDSLFLWGSLIVWDRLILWGHLIMWGSFIRQNLHFYPTVYESHLTGSSLWLIWFSNFFHVWKYWLQMLKCSLQMGKYSLSFHLKK